MRVRTGLFFSLVNLDYAIRFTDLNVDRERGYSPAAYSEPTVGSGGLRNALTRVIDESARAAASACVSPSLQVA